MNFRTDDTIDCIVSKSLIAARVFSKYGIDFFSEGNKPMKIACRDANISCERLIRLIGKAELSKEAEEDVDTMEIDALTRFIEKHHHISAYENIIFIKNNIDRLVRIYGNKYSSLEVVSRIFVEMTSHLTVHMRHEEYILFPYIREMVKHGRKVRSNIFKSVNSPIASMVMDHRHEMENLKELDDLTRQYTPPVEGCVAFDVTYEALRQFEKDLSEHIMLENEILFPKALDMESRFNMAPYRRQ